MNKKIIYIIIAIFAVIGLIVLASYLLSFRNVSFVLNSDVSGITIYKQGSATELQKLSSSQTIRLQTGGYSITPSGTKIATNEISTTIAKDTEININPDYSQSYLSSQLPDAEKSILAVLKSKYPAIISSYDIQKSQLFTKGQWFGGVLVNKASSYDNKKDLYRFIALKENDTWQIVSYPDLVLTKKIYSNVPLEILNTVNEITIDN